MLLGLPVALFPALNAAHFGGSPRTLGLLNAAVGVGGLLSAVLSGPAARVSRQGRGMLAGTMIWGAAIAFFGVTGSLAVALLMLAVAGAADTLTVTFRASMVQAVTPDEFRGRVSSVEYIIGTGGAPLGNVESGTVASLTTPGRQRGQRRPRLPGHRRADRAAVPRLRPLPGHRGIAWPMDVEVADNPDKARFEIVADGELAGFLQYHLRDGVIAFTHTETDDRFRGHGLGSQLVRRAWTTPARGTGCCPTARSSYSWIASHREYANLVPGAGQQLALDG